MPHKHIFACAQTPNENISFLDSVYDLYRSELIGDLLIGDLLIGDHDLTSSLLSEIKEKKRHSNYLYW